MERLTSNKPVDEMNMVELAYNACYAENRKEMYRDFETVRDARDFARELYEAYVNKELPTDDDEFDGRMIDELQYEPTIHANGLIALFYRNLWAMADLREKLKYYEDAEEQGLLLRLPCKVGDTVWDIDCGKPYAYKVTGYSFGTAEDYIDGPVKEDEIVYYCTDSTGSITGGFVSSVIGKAVFLTKEEAEQALKQMGE